MKRNYGDSCGIARALDVIGDRWALLIVRELLLGPKRFTDLRAGLPGIGPDVLVQRLRELQDAGALRRGTLGAPAAAHVYALTPRGAELGPVLLALGRWGSREPLPAAPPPLSADAFAVALKTMFAAPARGEAHHYTLRVGEHEFAATVSPAGLQLARGRAPQGATEIASDTATLSDLIWHGGSLMEALRAGKLQITGSRRAALQFLSRFGGVGSPVASEQ